MTHTARHVRHVHSDLGNNVSSFALADDSESCFVLSNTARVVAIKLLGSFSRNDLTERGLTDEEIEAAGAIYRGFQT